MRSRLRHLPPVLAACAGLAVVALLIGYAVRGAPGALGAAVGVALVVANYVASTLAIAWADTVNPRLVLPVGLTVYGMKVAVFFGVMLAVAATDWPGLVPMALGIVAGVVVWNGIQIWWLQTHPPVAPEVPAGPDG